MLNLKAKPVDIAWDSSLPIYASPTFLQAGGDEFGWIGGTDDQASLRCILPYSIIRKPGMRMIRFRTQTIPFAEEIHLDEEKSFLNQVVEYFRSIGADIIIPSGNTAVFRTYPDGASAVPYGTIINDLSRPEDVLMGEIRTTYRRYIRKASAAEVRIDSAPKHIDVAYELVSETMRRSGSSFKSYKEYRDLILALGENVKIFVAEHNGVVQGCMVAPFSKHTAYNCYAGSLPTPTLGSMHLLHWEAMRQFRAMGVRYFDFQGIRINPEKKSKQEGIMHYKQGFGGTSVQGYLWKYPLRSMKSIAYSLAVRLLKGGDIVDQEHARFTHGALTS